MKTLRGYCDTIIYRFTARFHIGFPYKIGNGIVLIEAFTGNAKEDRSVNIYLMIWKYKYEHNEMIKTRMLIKKEKRELDCDA